MVEHNSLSPGELRQVNALAVSFSITGIQAIYLYRLAGRSRSQTEAALIRAEIAGEDIYTGAFRRLSEEE